MKCEYFMVLPNGDLLCGRPPAGGVVVGSALRVPRDLEDDQVDQINAWMVVSSLGAAVGNYFSVMSHNPSHVEASVRFRISSKAEAVSKRLGESVSALRDDMRDEGWKMRLRETMLFDRTGGDMDIWELGVEINPKEENPVDMGPALQRLGQAIETTRLGEHAMDPASPWLPAMGKRRR